MRPILEVAKDKLGIDAEDLIPYGHYKAKVSLDYIASLTEQARRQADPRHRHHPDAGRRGQDHDHGRAWRCAERDRQEGHDLHSRAVAWALLRGEGRRRRRRLRAGRADGGHQPAFHRRLPRHRCRQQSARGVDRQSCLLGQQARHRHPPCHLAARRRHERPGAARHRHLARRAPPTAIRAKPASTSPWPRKSWRSSAWPATWPIFSVDSARSKSARPATRKPSPPRTSRPRARWRRCSRTRSRPISCRRSRTTLPSSMAGRSPTSRMAATR